jgi:cytochrome c oxidase subunit 3
VSRVKLAGAIPLEGTTRSEHAHSAPPSGLYPIFLLGLLATVTMLFAALTAAILIRRTGSDWVPVQLPGIVWANALVILASSAFLELARRSLRMDDASRAPVWLGLSAATGVAFLVGQLMAWSALMEQGVFLPTSPHASFFYMLSAVHGAHVLGGLGALGWTLRNALGGVYSADQHRGLSHAAIYWHYVGAIWIYLLLILRIA